MARPRGAGDDIVSLKGDTGYPGRRAKHGKQKRRGRFDICLRNENTFLCSDSVEHTSDNNKVILFYR